MARLSGVLLVCYSVCGFTSAAAVKSFEFAAHRESADAGLLQRKRQTGSLSSALGKSLYWFTHFNVGDAENVRLLIDTGSTDLLMNEGVYKPSSNEKAYKGKKNFTISYEGVNRAGFGFETLNGTTMTDTVTAGGLTVKNQAMGTLTSYKYFDVPQLPYAMQGDGICGFAGPTSSSFSPGANSWFWNLCENGSISKCKLGLVFGTSGKGLTVIGKLAKKYLKGDLVAVKDPKNEYIIKGDVTVNNTIVLKNQTIIMDVGTDNIQGPLGETRKILESLGYTTHTRTGPNIFDPKSPVKDVTAFFPCDSPPTIGFSFPAEADLEKGQTAKNFNVSPAGWDVYNHGTNNCTSILGGTNALGSGDSAAWLLGQPFFAGHYVDFDLTAKTISFGDLVDPAMSNVS